MSDNSASREDDSGIWVRAKSWGSSPSNYYPDEDDLNCLDEDDLNCLDDDDLNYFNEDENVEDDHNKELFEWALQEEEKGLVAPQDERDMSVRDADL